MSATAIPPNDYRQMQQREFDEAELLLKERRLLLEAAEALLRQYKAKKALAELYGKRSTLTTSR